MTDNTPDLPKEDDSFLDDILKWGELSTERIAKDAFVKEWLPFLASKDEAVREKAWRNWEGVVAKSYSVPVYVLNEEGNPAWLVPPRIGQTNSGFTGNETSMNTQNQMVATLRNRMVHIGEAAQDQMFRDIQATSNINSFYQMNWYVILRDFGYLEDDNGVVLGLGPAGSSSAQPSAEVYAEDDYDN